jgi:hypothetical protein
LPAGTAVVGRLSKVADVRPGIPLKVNFGVQLPVGMEDIAKQLMVVRQLEGKPSAKLNLASFGHAILDPQTGQFASPLEIHMHSNFAVFIERWTVTVREAFTGTVIKTFNGDRSNLFEPILWSGDTDQGVLNDRDSYTLQLTVEDQHQRQASTRSLPIEVQALEVGDKVESNANPTRAESLVSLSTMGQIERNDIRITGKLVQVSGKDFSHINVIRAGHRLFTMPHLGHIGQSASDLLARGLNTNNAPTEVILPLGKFRFIATIVNQEEGNTKLEQVNGL